MTVSLVSKARREFELPELWPHMRSQCSGPWQCPGLRFLSPKCQSTYRVCLKLVTGKASGSCPCFFLGLKGQRAEGYLTAISKTWSRCDRAHREGVFLGRAHSTSRQQLKQRQHLTSSFCFPPPSRFLSVRQRWLLEPRCTRLISERLRNG